MSEPGTTQHIRQPAVAGYFYPQDPRELHDMVDSYLHREKSADEIPKAIVVPHAGYIYSGAIAGQAYSRFLNAAERIRTVVLLGPAHRVYLEGMALSEAEQFQTPLGRIQIDSVFRDSLLDRVEVVEMESAHEKEHSLEVHLPFLQLLFNDFSLLPIVVGQIDAATVSEILESIWGGDETLIIISSDLSHFHPYDIARKIDDETAMAIQSYNMEKIGPEQACGCMPLNGMLHLAKKKAMRIVNYELKNSGDTAGDKSRVVGYGAWGLYPS